MKIFLDYLSVNDFVSEKKRKLQTEIEGNPPFRSRSPPNPTEPFQSFVTADKRGDKYSWDRTLYRPPKVRHVYTHVRRIVTGLKLCVNERACVNL